MNELERQANKDFDALMYRDPTFDEQYRLVN